MNFINNFDFSLLNYVLLWNSLKSYLIAFWILLVVYIFIKIIKKFILKTLEKVHSFKDINFVKFLITLVNSIWFYFYIALYLYFPLKYLVLSDSLNNLVDVLIIAALILQLISICIKIIDYWLKKFFIENPVWEKDVDSYNLFMLIWKICIWLIWWLIFLANIWVEITPLLASLWIWGLAIAFASKNILENVFATVLMYIDRPFKIWDFIAIWSDKWKVKQIWIKSTYLETDEWSVVIVPNKDFVNVKVTNLWKIDKKKVVLNFKFSWDLELEKIEYIQGIFSKVLEEFNFVNNQKISFKPVAGNIIEYEIKFSLGSNDYNQYKELESKINFRLFEELKKENILTV